MEGKGLENNLRLSPNALSVQEDCEKQGRSTSCPYPRGIGKDLQVQAREVDPDDASFEDGGGTPEPEEWEEKER